MSEMWETAAEHVEFQLAYDRAPERRVFDRHCMDGPSMPNAYGAGIQSGEWSDFDAPVTDSAEGWIDKFARMAISEAVHEALEWFRVDGKPWLDPHGNDHEAAIHDAVNELCERLAAMRREELA